MPQLRAFTTVKVSPDWVSSYRYQFVDVCTWLRTVSIEKSVCRTIQ
jgi:hypothetical protein